MLRGYINLEAWDEQLVYIQHSYNQVLHSSTNKSLFETCFGHLPPPPFDIMYAWKKEEEKLHWEVRMTNICVERIQQIHLKVYKNLEKIR
jgi:hypothetical protein